MDSRKQFEPEWRLEALDKLAHPIEPSQRILFLLEEHLSVVHCTWNEFKLLVRSIPTICIARHKMTLDGKQNMPKIFRIWAVRCLFIFQFQRLASLLHEIHELVHF